MNERSTPPPDPKDADLSLIAQGGLHALVKSSPPGTAAFVMLFNRASLINWAQLTNCDTDNVREFSDALRDAADQLDRSMGR